MSSGFNFSVLLPLCNFILQDISLNQDAPESPDWHSYRSAEILSSHCSTKSHDEARRTKFNCVHTLSHSLARTCSLIAKAWALDPFWVRVKMVYKMIVDTNQDRVFSVTFCLCIFIYSFIHFASRNCCVLATKDKIPGQVTLVFSLWWIPSPPLPQQSWIFPPDASALLSKYLNNSIHHSRLYWCLLIFPNFFELLEDT